MMSNTDNSRKRPFGATFRTLNDITNSGAIGVGANDNGNNASSSSSSSSSNNNNNKIKIQHIPSLPADKEAAAILRRIHTEFHVLIEKRGWNVTSITEMCCCGDGIDCLRKGGRKTKVMPNNVLGYNRTSFSRRGNVHDIHLRLRHPRTHELVDYESIAGTMCHELAHCVRGPHDAKFYEAMEEIEEQYSIYLAKGVVLDRDGFPIGSSESHTLGSSSSSGGKNNVSADRRKAMDAAERRRKKNQNGLTSGYVLGGKPSSSSLPKDPREAARIAAERRFLDAQYCLPCNEIIELLGEDSDEEGDSEVEIVEDVVTTTKKGKAAGTKRGSDKPKAKSDTNNSLDTKPKAKDYSTTSDDVIDLTLDDSFTMTNSPVAALKPASKRKRNPNPSTANNDTCQSQWTCPTCTLSNPSRILVCDACHSERPCDKTVLDQAKELKKEDDIADIKEREVQQSKETFGGFNIYGEKKNSSSTMKHLT